MEYKSEWISYILGAFLTLAYKLARTIYFERKQGKKTSEIICDWFFAPTGENATSWMATIGGVWMIGSFYIQRVGFPALEWLATVPIVDSFAFFLGCLAEMTVPALAKKIVSKFTG